MNDDLGDRIRNYEDRFRYYLPRRTYTIVRLDGKCFSKYTSKLQKPFDLGLVEDLDNAVIKLMYDMQGAQFAYVQSDEVSILLTDFENPTTDAWFDGNIQKICSVSASLLTGYFNQLRLIGWMKGERYKNDILPHVYLSASDIPLGFFDSRAFVIPDPIEVYNAVLWRQKDCIRNSVSQVASSLYSHNELLGKKHGEKHEMIFQKGINWNDYDLKLKNGRIIIREEYLVGETKRNRWISNGAPVFSKNTEFLKNLIPKYS